MLCSSAEGNTTPGECVLSKGAPPCPGILFLLALFERIKKPQRDKSRPALNLCVCGGGNQAKAPGEYNAGRRMSRTLAGHLRSGQIILKHPHKLPWQGGEASVLCLSISIFLTVKIYIFSSIQKSD